MQTKFLSAKCFVSVAALIALAGWLPAVQAGAMFSSTGNARLTLTGVTAVNDDYSIRLAQSSHASNHTTISGNAFADRDGTVDFISNDPENVSVGDAIELFMHAEGWSAATHGSGSASQRADAKFWLTNLTGAEIVLNFDYEYDYDISQQTDEAMFDTATSEATFNVHVHAGTLSQGINDTFGPGTDGGSFSFTYTVPGSITSEVDVHTYLRARGSAVTVPEPSSLALAGAGLVGLLVLRRRG